MGLYLDYNASAPMLNSSMDAMIESMKLIGNPSSIHTSGRKAKNAIEDSRELVAETIDIAPQNIIFTSGASESFPFHSLAAAPSRLHSSLNSSCPSDISRMFHDHQLQVEHQPYLVLDAALLPGALQAKRPRPPGRLWGCRFGVRRIYFHLAFCYGFA